MSAPVGGTITWRLRVSDKTSGPATGVYVDVELPAGVTLVLAQTDRGSGCVSTGAGKLRCSLDWLSSGVPSGNVTLVTTVTAAGELVLTATAGYCGGRSDPGRQHARAEGEHAHRAGTGAACCREAEAGVREAARAAGTPLAGKRFTFTLAVKRSDTGAPLTAGRMVCDPSVAGKLIRHAESFKAGKARLTFLVPKTAKGKQLKIKIKIVSGGQSATKVFTYKVR